MEQVRQALRYRIGTRKFSPRRVALLVPMAFAALLLFVHLKHNLARHTEPRLAVISLKSTPKHYDRSTLGVGSKIFVISLPTRTDRREDMEHLRVTLGLRWLYVDALPARTELVTRILDWVNALRSGTPDVETEAQSIGDRMGPSKNQTQFTWPENIDALASSGKRLDFWSTGIWSSPSGFSEAAPYRPIACATQNYAFSENSVEIPEHLVLTPSRVACWHSHMSVIHSFANSRGSNNYDVAIVLEDDVDMESDISNQLEQLWEYLPSDWDILFLGHCWSNETRYQPISPFLPFHNSVPDPPSSNARLYPSFKPKCTHAYALSKIGARRLLLHLRYPPFAYSRAIDQAFSWLVESGRLKSFSAVPSLVVQRKIGSSDVISGTGSKWKDHLVNGVFQT